MKPLLVLVPFVLLWPAAPLPAGAILVSSSITGSNEGSSQDPQHRFTTFHQYADTPSKTQGSSTQLSVTSSHGYSLGPQGHLSGGSTGTATFAPSLGDFTSFTYAATAGTSSFLDASQLRYSQSDLLDYNGTFTVTSPLTYQLTITGSTSTSFSYPHGSDSALSKATLTGPKGALLAAYDSSTDGAGTFVFTGTLAPGTYAIFGETSLTSGGSGGASSSESASLNDGLQLSPAATPEPASLTLLGLGACGLAGYGWRRRKRSVTV